MENNGPANIVMLTDAVLENYKQNTLLNSHLIEALFSISKEAHITIKYMKEIAEVLEKHNLQDEIPKWHEVKEKK